MADLKDKVALICGADDALGSGIARGLAEAGASLYLLDTTEGGAAHVSVQDTALAVSELGGKANVLELGVQQRCSDEALLELFRCIEAEAGQLDLLVNSPVRVLEDKAPAPEFWAQPLTAWEEAFRAILHRSYLTSALGARLMVEKGRGLIVQMVDFSVEYMGVVSGTLGAAMQRMSEEMAAELNDHGVTALSLAPGPVVRSPRFVGRCIAALAMDPDIMEKSGDHFEIETLQKEYRFSDPGRGDAHS